jgi:hypothetical protein
MYIYVFTCILQIFMNRLRWSGLISYGKYVCIHICIYIYIYIYIYTRLYINTHIFTYILSIFMNRLRWSSLASYGKYVYIHICTYIYIYTCLYINTHIYSRIYYQYSWIDSVGLALLAMANTVLLKYPRVRGELMAIQMASEGSRRVQEEDEVCMCR